MRWVSDLLDGDGNWDEPKLRRLFLSVDVDEILKIKPSQRNEQDLFAWNPEKNGLFTVKSAYHLALNRKVLANKGASSGRPDGARPDWKLIWSCPVPPKVRVFAWKLASNGLATQTNKQRREMEITSTCPICG